jgi:hypothetical protein
LLQSAKNCSAFSPAESQGVEDLRLRLSETAIGEHLARSGKVVQFTEDLLNVRSVEKTLQTEGVARTKQFQRVAKALRLKAKLCSVSSSTCGVRFLPWAKRVRGK